MKDSDPRPAPPVPPRRLKRKNKPTATRTDRAAEVATTSVIRLEERPRLPPPPPPQRGFPRRGIRPQEPPPPEVKRNTFQESYSEEKCHSPSIIRDKLIANEIEEVRPSLSTFGTTLPLSRDNGWEKKPLGKEPNRKKREKGRIHRPNEYPPLFFTLQDFQDVMSDVENPYSRTLKNMTTFEPTPKPRASQISDRGLPDTPENESVLFRVTTTNLPFEKSLSESTDVGDDRNHFVFEDYVDRRQKLAQRKSKPSNNKLILFGDDTFDHDDEDRTLSTSHTASRVRFLVDSPTKNENCEKIAEPDSLQNIDSLPLDILPSQESIPGLKLNQEKGEDAFGDVPFDSLLTDPASSLCVDFSENSTSSKTDFQTILVHATVEPVPPVGEVEKYSRIGERISNSNIKSVDERSAHLLEEEVISKEEDVCEEPKSPSFKKSDFDSEMKCAEKKNSVSIQLSENPDEGMKTIDRRGEKRKIMVDESLLDVMEVGNIGAKSPSEKVRRNSFLMNMLQGDERPEPEAKSVPEPEPEPNEGKVCKVVATHPKTPIHESCRIDGGTEGGKRSAAVEAKSKLLGELSSSFSAIKLKRVNNFGEVERKRSASDLKVDSMNVERYEEGKEEIVQEVEIQGDEDRDNDDEDKDENREAGDDMKYKSNRNLDSVLDINVVKCKVIEERIEESSNKIYRIEPQDRSNVCSQKTDEIIIDKKKYVEDASSVCQGSNKIEVLEEIDTTKKRNIEKQENRSNVEESDNNNDDDNGDKNRSMKQKENHNNSNNINNNNNHNNILEVASKSSVDKCAIVLKCNNNNDNNAMTPVDVSYDQSQNNVSIIPGSVRSFVKFYEIQGETSVGLNSNDITAVVPKMKVEATGNTSSDDFLEMTAKDIISCPVTAGMEIENDIKYTIVTRKPVAAVLQRHRNEVSADKKQAVNQRIDKSDKLTGDVSSATLCKTNGKRDARFSAGSTLVRSKNIGPNEPEETRRTIKVDAVTSSWNNARSDIAPGITQDGSTAGATKDIVRSGTANHSVPKSSTSAINEHYTFYCTV